MQRLVLAFALVACVATLVAGQAFVPQPAGRILEPPVPSLCAQRKIHEKFNGKGYYFSWKDASTANQQMDWLGIRNWCRQRCMDSISPETSVENEYIKKKLVDDKVKYIWTSGRLCDFKGCEERVDLKPLNVNGWFWTAELKKLAPTTDRTQNDWGYSGGINKPQPDNRELIQGGAPENCLAILNNFYNDGVHWHDVACHHKKPWVCEESEALVNYVRFTNPNIGV
ncbi:hypothetical protein ONE63_007061 [Megalurothrips usitatus]|uniref:C-type lectin domain-containing protein n=1 Tax=Megalurothrips usitatus TaxID=439358 RepID=A0AAV7XYD4_9NEOP|nr:hypothetical protein ONE63_007061 [Megalurothrips usitatus]